MKQFSGVPYAHPCPVFHRIDVFVTHGGGWHIAIVVVKEGMVVVGPELAINNVVCC